MEGVSGAQGQNGAKVIKAASVTLRLTQMKSLHRWTWNLFGFGFLEARVLNSAGIKSLTAQSK